MFEKLKVRRVEISCALQINKYVKVLARFCFITVTLTVFRCIIKIRTRGIIVTFK